MTNPYHGSLDAPGLFFGRAQTLTEIANFLRGNQSVSIVGPSKIGKTSLLRQLLRPETQSRLGLAADTLFAFLDCETLEAVTHEAVFGQFARKLAAALLASGLSVEPALQTAMEQPSRLAFEAAVRQLNRRDLRLVLMLDQFERLSSNPYLKISFFNTLRSTAGRYQLAFLTASAQPLIELTFADQAQEILSSPFFNIFAPLYLGLLPEAEARQLIREPARTAGREFSPAMEDDVYALAGGHPLILQAACFHAFETPQAAPEVIEQKTLQELLPHFQHQWNNLTSAEQAVLQQASRSLTNTNDPAQRTVMRRLIQKCLLIVENGTYRYPSHAWAKFMALQKPVPG